MTDGQAGSAAAVGRWLRRVYGVLRGNRTETARFDGSGDYWERRYAAGGTSGAGSYSELAAFKADVLNEFVAAEGIRSVIEFGCGDGNQLSLARYPAYTGLDVSDTAIAQCRERFAGDASKAFRRMDDYAGETAELSLSLDVIYHLVEDPVYEQYMQVLFDAAERFVVVYSTDTDRNPVLQAPHVRHRRFTDWVEANATDWSLCRHVPNRFPTKGLLGKGSNADFYIFANNRQD